MNNTNRQRRRHRRPLFASGSASGAEAGRAPGGFQLTDEQQKCLKEQGVEMPSGKPGGAPNTDSASFRKSVKAYVACMDEHGYEMPEPNLSGEGPVFDESEVDRESAEFKQASAKCQSKLGGPQS